MSKLDGFPTMIKNFWRLVFISVWAVSLLVIGLLVIKTTYQPLKLNLSAEQIEKYRNWENPKKGVVLPPIINKIPRNKADRGLVWAYNVIERETVRRVVREEAIKHGVDPELADWIVKKESNYNSKAIGDDGNSRGLWMISSIYNPQVSDKCAFDVKCSTNWAMKELAAGNKNKWSVVRFCKNWYLDCPL